MKVRFLTDRSDGIEAGDVVDLGAAEAKRVIASGAGEPVPTSTRSQRRRTENHQQNPAGETR